MRLGAIQLLRSRLVSGKDAIKDTFLSTKGVFEQHKLVFTVGTSILSAGAAWAGYVGRQVHQEHVENRLNSIENAMKSQPNMPEDQVLALTRAGVSVRTCLASVGTASVITYILGFRSGRKFTLARIEKQKQRLLLAMNNPKVPISQRLQQRLNTIKQRAGWRRKKNASSNSSNNISQEKRPQEEEQLYPGCA